MQIVQWIKAHLTVVICGAMGVLAITAIVLGVLLSDAQELLARDAAMLSSLDSIRPVNPGMIEEQKQIRDKHAQQVQKILDDLAKMGSHTPLNPDVFPTINPRNQDAPFLFKDAFTRAQRDLLALLNAKDAPSPAEVNAEAAYIAAQKAKELELQNLGRIDEDQRGKGKGVRGDTMLPPGAGLTPGPGEAAPQGRGTDSTYRANLTPEQLVAEYPEVRVSVRRARGIYCYANEASLDLRPAVTGTSRPILEEMWYAQMALWIEQDVLGQLAALNNARAEELKAAGKEAWVGTLPVKHLVRFTVGGYEGSGSGGDAGMGGDMLRYGGGSPGASVTGAAFTQRAGTDSVDVIRFSMELVVEAERLPAVIGAICSAGFYTPLLVNYQTEPPNLELVGYIYGSEPAMRVQLEFEGCFLRNKYDAMMPETVKTAIPLGQAQGTGAAGGGGGGGGMPTRHAAPVPGGGGRPREDFQRGEF